MKKLYGLLSVFIITQGISYCQLTQIGGGLNLASGFHYSNETVDRDLYRSPMIGLYLKALINSKTALKISPSLSLFIPRNNKIPDVGTSFRSTRINEFSFNVDGNYPFFSPGWLELYGLGGINITIAKIKWTDGAFTPGIDNALGLNMGAGLNFIFTNRITLNGEAKFIAGKYHQIMYTGGILINIERKKIDLK